MPSSSPKSIIVFAGYSPKIVLLGISTVAANQTLKKVTQNALQILEAAALHHIGKSLIPSLLLGLWGSKQEQSALSHVCDSVAIQHYQD